jgi:hypothetical protein
MSDRFGGIACEDNAKSPCRRETCYREISLGSKSMHGRLIVYRSPAYGLDQSLIVQDGTTRLKRRICGSGSCTS